MDGESKEMERERNRKMKMRKRALETRRKRKREREIMMKQFVVTCISLVERLCDVCAEDSFLLCTVAVILGYEIMAFVLKMDALNVG